MLGCRRALWSVAPRAWFCSRGVVLTPIALDNSAAPERRRSGRRYAKENMRGRHMSAKEEVQKMRKMSATEARAHYDHLMPRDKLGVLRLLHHQRKQRRIGRAASRLPKYRSSVFERRYYFREEDVTEESTLGRGPGGQATNRRMQTVILKHSPTGLIVKYSRFPSLWLNRRAARELLHLRLEEQLLGKDSQLGQEKAVRERRRRRRRRSLNRLYKRGDALTALNAKESHYHAFLTGEEPLPPCAAAQLGERLGQNPVFVTTFFEEECRNLWPVLDSAFRTINQGRLQHENADAATTQTPQLPQVVHFLFPMADPSADPPMRARTEKEIERCRDDEAALRNVRRAFHCFCELFGLRVCSVARKCGGERLVLQRDGLNWVELRRRMIQPDGHLTPLALVAWPRVYGSLRALRLQSEASSVRAFFAAEVKKQTTVPTSETANCWAVEASSAMNRIRC